MFILHSTHKKEILRHLEEKRSLLERLNAEKLRYAALQEEWNALVTRINARGGESFLRGQSSPPQFSKEELRQLISLCHPDKHGGSERASYLTAKLNALRSQ
jgi:hypothetical protein